MNKYWICHNRLHNRCKSELMAFKILKGQLKISKQSDILFFSTEYTL